MSVKSSRMYSAPVPTMPPGLVELMEGLAKEVLKCNPPDVYSFCANHMKTLLQIRDGPTSKRTLTLDQKITLAQKKIRARALRRRNDYDNNATNQSKSQNNEGCESVSIDKNNFETGRYSKDNIVIIPEEDLIGDVEHEIVVEVKEKPLSTEFLKSEVFDTETGIAEIKSPNNALQSDTLQECIKIDDLKEHSHINVIENVNDNEIIEEKQIERSIENETNIDKGQSDYHVAGTGLDVLPKKEEKCLESVDKTENNSEIENSVEVCSKTEGHIDCEPSSINDDDHGKCDIETNIQDAFNNSNGSNNGSIVVIDHNDFQQTGVMNNCNNSDKTNLYSSVNMEGKIYNGMKFDKGKVSFEEQQDTKLISKNILSDDLINENTSELQNQVPNTSMDLETAAITIQKVFRNFLFRNKTLSSDDATNVDLNSLIEDKNEMGDNDISRLNINKDRRTLGLSRTDAVLQTVNEEKSLSQSTDDSSTLSSAATVIQAHVRGFLTRNKINLNKNSSTTSGVDSDGLSFTSLEGDNDYRKNKTILNIHIVPESGHFLSRDESVLTSTDLSMDGSPPCSSTALHPLGYERNERRKQLRREDAIQSISPPSNNSGKSEDVDSVKEILINRENNKDENPIKLENDNEITDAKEAMQLVSMDDLIPTMVDNFDTALEVKSLGPIDSPVKYMMEERPNSLPEMTSDEMDVITPFTPSEEKLSNANLIHSGEFHEVVLPTKVARSDTSVVSGE